MRVAEQQRLKRSSAQVRKDLGQHIAYLEGRITQKLRWWQWCVGSS
jgi:hypothetical protein